MDVSHAEQPAPEGQVLDPFSFHVGIASRIPGLGGIAPGHDPTYIFHTPYVEAEPGICHFTVQFTGLTARRGTLQLWINMLPNVPGANARVANSERISLNRLVEYGGGAKIRFEAFRGVSFALHGQIPDDTDIEALGLAVILDRPADPSNAGSAPEGKSSDFGTQHVRAASHILSTLPATFANPCSQAATLSQLRDPQCRAWIADLGLDECPAVDQWSSGFIMQTLQKFGMLEAGATGLALGIGTATDRLPAALIARGLSVKSAKMMMPDPTELEDSVEISPREEAETFDLTQLPGKLINFDFLWSDDILTRLGAGKAAVEFTELAMQCLRPGGLAVFLAPFSSVGSASSTTETAVFERHHIERTALQLISRAFEVAQVKIDTRDPLITQQASPGQADTRFALIARRPPTAY